MNIKDIIGTAILAALAAAGPAATAVAKMPLDAESIECLSCHDAALAVDSSVITVCSGPDCDHPIGVDYVSISYINSGYRPSALLDPAMQLPESRIGCTTCHVEYSPSNHSLLSSLRTTDPNKPDPMLTVSNLGSGLCLECHRK